ncbi:hypothetical protein F4777DRAFT_483348 [Nemania sp. FL0916]|nr:hypothetical protein F4777DRAFT_483348 [Nemania sp. FL0916]
MASHPIYRGNQSCEWPTFAQTGFKIKCQCAICNSFLAITTPTTEEDVEAFTILPSCGHAFGYHCIWNRFLNIDTEAKCLTCGVSARHQCGHLAKLEKMEQKNNFLSVKAVDPSAFPSRCQDCARNRPHELFDGLRQPDQKNAWRNLIGRHKS